MTKRVDFPVDEEGNIVGQKAIVGSDRGRILSAGQRLFLDRSLNWVAERRVKVRIRTRPRHIRGQTFPLDEGRL